MDLVDLVPQINRAMLFEARGRAEFILKFVGPYQQTSGHSGNFLECFQKLSSPKTGVYTPENILREVFLKTRKHTVPLFLSNFYFHFTDFLDFFSRLPVHFKLMLLV